MDGEIVIVDWEKFQHYKNRNPPWIKLHTKLLRNYQFRMLSDEQKVLLRDTGCSYEE